MQYDALVIGTGSAAFVAATRIREAGRTVAVMDAKPFGGTCALRGCDPKKMLLASVEAFDFASRMRGNGVTGNLKLDWPAMVRFKRTFTDPVSRKREARFREMGIDAFHGEAKFTGANTLEVGGHAFSGDHIVIATGAEPAILGIPGEQYLATNEDFLSLERLPARIAVVGGGYVAAEFSHIAAGAGAKVTVLQRGPRMLGHFEPELVGWLMQGFATSGVEVRLNTEVKAVEKRGDAFVVTASQDRRVLTFEADLVVHAGGRVPSLAHLDLHRAGVAVQHGRLVLNAFLQSTTNPAIYGAGDAAQVGQPLTPVSGHDGKVVAANILNGNHSTPDYRGVPSVAFSLPPIAAVGLGEAEARGLGLRFRVNCAQTPEWFTARRVAELIYGHKTLVEEGTGRLLGAHLVGPGVDEVINVFGLAIRHGLTADDLKGTMFAYPTGASDIGDML